MLVAVGVAKYKNNKIKHAVKTQKQTATNWMAFEMKGHHLDGCDFLKATNGYKLDGCDFLKKFCPEIGTKNLILYI